MSRHDSLSVVVDSREPEQLDEWFDMHDDVAVVDREQLAVGDVVVDDAVVFERKAPNDFVQSIRDRRLENQIGKMYDAYGPERSYLLIEGNVQDIAELRFSGMNVEAVYGYIGSICARYQMIPLFTGRREWEIDLVTRIARKHKETTERVIRKPESTPTKKSHSYFRKMVMQLDGIGPKTAKAITTSFAGPEPFVTASEERLQQVDGIGPKRAEQIHAAVTGEQ